MTYSIDGSRFKSLRAKTSLSQTDFSAKYGIPLRTLQNWESDASLPPNYVYDLLVKTVAGERIRPVSYVFTTYHEDGAIGSQMLFSDRDKAVIYAANEWASMNEYDKRHYKEDAAGRFDVTLQFCEWDDSFEEFIPTEDILEDVWSAF